MFDSLWPALFLVGEFFVKLAVIAFILTRRNRNPATNLAWIAVIFSIPLLGIGAYLMFGEAKLGRRRLRRHRELERRIARAETTTGVERPKAETDISSDYAHLGYLAEAVGGNAARGGNRIELLSDTDLFIQTLIEDIDAAKEHCHLQFYIFINDHSGRRVSEALIRAAERGVECRLLVDSVGSRPFLKSELHKRLEENGVQVVEGLPARALRLLFARQDLRNHRKIVVIDGRISYNGSHNLCDSDFALKKRFAPWVDAMVRIEGPVTCDLHSLFIADWYMDTDESLVDLLDCPTGAFEEGIPAQIMGNGPTSSSESMHQLVQAAFHTAHEELILTTPYLVPDESTLTALQTVARRGVETTLIVPKNNDSPLVALASRSFYDDLLSHGVNLMEFDAGLLHAKTMTIDRSMAIVTSANLDRRSFELNFEASVIVYDTDFASQLRLLQKSYMNQSKSLQLADWRRRPWAKKLLQNAAGTLSPIL